MRTVPSSVRILAALSFFALGAAIGASAETTPAAAGQRFAAASLFQDHMVLQRDSHARIWGTAPPGEVVTLRFANQVKEAKADNQGVWRTELDPMPASMEGRELTMEGKGGGKIVLKDVLVGEVWLASGQSNMGITLAATLNAREEMQAAEFPHMRFFAVPTRGSFDACNTTPGQWEMVSPATARKLSAVAYFFSREIHRTLAVPVGVIVSAVGGTPAEAWTPGEALAKDAEWNKAMTDTAAALKSNEAYTHTFVDSLQAWRTANNCQEPSPKTEWADPQLNAADWRKASGRFTLAKEAGLSSGGVIWLRKEFEVPGAKAGKPASLWFDMLDRQILTLYLNGKEISVLGLTGPRYYQGGLVSVPVAADLVQSGRNVLAIRCTTFTADTQKYFSAPRMRLPVGEPEKLDDQWLLKVETPFPALSAAAVEALPRFSPADISQLGGSLYNGMIHPLIPYTIRGAIWYQGESNIKLAARYKDLMTTLIGEWRARWGNGDFPFYLVQLANHYGPSAMPAPADRISPDDDLGRLREAQLQVAQGVPQSGLAVTIDIGGKSIHPVNKQDVGDRLARIALARTYGKTDLDGLSPIYDSMAKEGSAIRIKFGNCPSGLMVAAKTGLEPAKETPGAKLQQFAIAGADNRFVWADARIDGDTVLVSSPSVSNPASVRYAWSQNPEGCNLYGRNGLPASPFRTDSILPAPKRTVGKPR